jgi:hypothetical protein
MRERHHNGHAGGSKTKEIITLLLGAERTGTDVFNCAHAVIGIDNFLTDLEGHSGTSFLNVVLN